MLGLREYLEPARLMRMLAVCLLGILAIYIEAAPLGIPVDAPPSPDLLLCVVAYWSIRRPGSIPLPLVFALGLARDLMTDTPVGAGVLSLVLISEAFKAWRRTLARSIFLIEWVWVAASSVAGAALIFVLMALTFAQPPYLVGLLHQCIYTAMVYPLLALVLRWGLRISWSRRQEPAQ